MSDSDFVLLPDGRRLETTMSGPKDGMPLVFHHGTPGSRLQIRAMQRAAAERDLRVITMSRPGYGGSTRQPGRRIIDVVADTEAVLRSVGADRCLVAGWSGGGPHALACAARLPEAAAVLVIAGVAPFDADGVEFLAGMGQDNIDEFGTALQGEAPLRSYLDAQRPGLVETTAEGVIAAMSSLLPDVDRAVLTDEFGEDMADHFHEALRTGVDGWLDDDLAFTTDWGFDLAEIAVPTAIWQGSEDLMVPFAHGRWLASRVPGASAHLQQGEGHLSVGVGAMTTMLDELVAAGRLPA